MNNHDIIDLMLGAMTESPYANIRVAAARARSQLNALPAAEGPGVPDGCAEHAPADGGAETAQAAVRPAVTISLADYVNRHDQIPVDPNEMPNPCDKDAYLKWYYARPGGYSGD